MSLYQRFFLGGASPTGFQSKFSAQIKKYDYYTYILKGAPGSGKSYLMKKIAEHFYDKNIEFFYSVSEPDTIDAIIIHDLKTIIADGTYPNCIDPVYYGVSQDIINLDDNIDISLLKDNKQNIIRLTDENMKIQSRIKRYIRAFASLNSNIYSIAYNSIIFDKMNAFIQRLSKKLFPKNSKKSASIEYKQMSALTSHGYITMPIPENYTVYELNDDYFAGSDFFLKSISDLSVNKGFNVVLSECTMLLSNSIEHMLIPELQIAFITTNFFNKTQTSPEKIVNFNRFYDKNVLSAKKQKVSFDKKASIELANEAISAFLASYELNADIKKYYSQSINLIALDRLAEKIISSITNN